MGLWDQYTSGSCMYVCAIMEVGVCELMWAMVVCCIVYLDVNRGGLRGCWVNGSVWTLG